MVDNYFLQAGVLITLFHGVDQAKRCHLCNVQSEIFPGPGG